MKIRSILEHVEDLPEEAAAPIAHYRWSSTHIWDLLRYTDSLFENVSPFPDVARRHRNHLHSMVLIHQIEAFERFLKEAAAVCVDQLIEHVLDDRFGGFSISASYLVAHFKAQTVGKSLCDPQTWLDCKKVNERFQKLLSLPDRRGEHKKDKPFLLLPRKTEEDQDWYDTLELIWQLRHTTVHNVGVITQADAVKFRLLVGEKVDAPRMLFPTRDDLGNLKQFLDETAAECNGKIGERLALVLSDLHQHDSGLFDARETADGLTQLFTIPLTVDNVTGNVVNPFDLVSQGAAAHE